MISKRWILSIVIVLFAVSILPDIFDPRKGFLFIVEELATLIALIVGIILFTKPVRKTIEKIQATNSWSKDPFKYGLSVLKHLAFYAFGLAAFLLITAVVVCSFTGKPEYLKKKDLILQNQFEGREHFHFITRDEDFNGFLFTEEILIFSFSLFILLFGIEEATRFTGRRQEFEIAREKRKKEEAEARAHSLSNQMNPHFLFNNLNVLSGLIHEDPDKAEEYLDKLAEIYRYVLQKNKEGIVTVEEELQFIDDYVFLLKLRFGEKFELVKSVDDLLLQHRLPSLCLELLIENTVKHNSMSEAKPLVVQVIVANEMLQVINESMPRTDKEESTQVSHDNLRERILLMGLEAPKFGMAGSQFIASIPLLKPTV